MDVNARKGLVQWVLLWFFGGTRMNITPRDATFRPRESLLVIPRSSSGIQEWGKATARLAPQPELGDSMPDEKLEFQVESSK
jgi:hypothetical protein